MLVRVVIILVFCVMSAAGADTAKVTVFDKEFRPVRAITSDRELATFNELWSRRVIAGPEVAFRSLYKFNIYRNGRSTSWLYDPAGLVQVLSKQKSPVYRLPSVAEFNALLVVPSRSDQSR